MNTDLAPALRGEDPCAVCFFDDILIFSKTLKDHFINLEKVLIILLKKQWRVKLSKCDFAKQEIAYLGHVISDKGVYTDASKIATVKNSPVPADVKQVRGFLGLTGYYRKFIKNYGLISRPLTDLLKKETIFVWTPATELAFQTLKEALVNAPVLALPDFSKQFVVETDACDVGIGAVLMQQGHPIAFVS